MVMAAGVSSPSAAAATSSSSLASADSSVWKGTPLNSPLTTHHGSCLPSRVSAQGLPIFAMASNKKVNAYDDNWNKQWFGAGIFVENTEQAPVNVVKILEKKKLLSQVEKAGLLSKAESAGLTLSSIEKMGLLSKAEELGLLSLAENLATTSPATLASLSLPLLVGAIATIVLIPDDSTVLVVVQNVIAALLALGAGGLFVASIIVGGLQED